jgi:thiol-disulfide isomerase/thioredoxin
MMLGLSASAQEVKLLTVDQLEARLKKGKDTTYVVNFWATWCGPCIEELPYFERLGAENKGRKVKVLLVSADSKTKLESAVKPFVKKRGLKNEVFLLNEKSQQVYIDRISKEWSGALPATLLVNTAARVRKFYEKEFTYNELKELVNKHKAK